MLDEDWRNFLLLAPGKHLFNVVDPAAEEFGQLADAVDSVVSIDDLAQGIAAGGVSGVVNHDVVSAVALGQDPVSSTVDVEDNDLSIVQVRFNGTVTHKANEIQTQFVDGGPNEEISAGISTIADEPLVESSWVVAVSSSREGHGGWAHKASWLADSFATSSSKGLTSPLWVTLLVEREVAGQGKSHEDCKNGDP